MVKARLDLINRKVLDSLTGSKATTRPAMGIGSIRIVTCPVGFEPVGSRSEPAGAWRLLRCAWLKLFGAGAASSAHRV